MLWKLHPALATYSTVTDNSGRHHATSSTCNHAASFPLISRNFGAERLTGLCQQFHSRI